ncbi:uncharacterized protein LOC129596128 [Paramacrobiotus metropolitanus]|uniref:uncharacterized protein LOC129596128 n=1 Tax=Paramacrobiotus metropolitanus TaxID=2943436 RepID=UPI002445AFB2|nr:uncharacterized protein LOC129596128 [Paramacrobiotus metropolitanus]
MSFGYAKRLTVVVLVMSVMFLRLDAEPATSQEHTGQGRTPLPRCTFSHRVTPGDSCEEIGETYGLARATIQNYNRNIDCSRLLVGQKVCLN